MFISCGYFLFFKEKGNMSSTKKINIVTINLNNKEGLEKTINSVIYQTFFNKLNYIIIDGGSTDGSTDIIEKYRDKLAFYISEKDSGIYNAMNKGIDHCDGEYVLFLNSGDYFHDSSVIESVYDELDRDIVYGALNVHAKNDKQYVINDDYFLKKGIPHPSCFIKVELLRRNKYKEDYKIISDWIFFYEQLYINRVPYKCLRTIISDFSLGGLLSNAEACRDEKLRYLDSKKKFSNVKIAMCSIGRMENRYAVEFVEYYNRIGVDKFFIYDNNYGDEEHFEDVLQQYIDNGIVEIIDYRNKSICQLESYQDCYDKHGKEYDWMCFFDFDEYLWIDNNSSLKELLSSEIYSGYDMIHVNELIYGDSGNIRYENKPLTQRFITPVQPINYKKTFDFPENCHVKTIVRGGIDGIEWKGTPHTPSSNNIKCCNSIGEPCKSNSPFVIPYVHKNIILRHYKTKSLEEYYMTKVKRGYPDGNKDFFKKNSWVKDYFSENEVTEDKKEFIKTLESGATFEIEDVYDGLISVVIPCYNQAKYVRDTIISVKASRYKDFCCVIVNDGSTDNSEEIILDEIRGDKRFKYYKTENKGLGHARNFGISKTRSKYILCLDSDDLISPYYIKKGVEFLERYKNFSIFYANANFLYENGEEKKWDMVPYSYKSLLLNNMIYCSHIFKRSDYEKTNGYDEDIYGFQDWEFLVQLLDSKSNVYKDNETMFYYRRHSDSMDYAVKDKRGKYLFYIYNKNKEKYHENNLKIEVKKANE